MHLYLLAQPHLEIGDKTTPLSKSHSQILAWLTMQQKSGVPLPRVRLARAIWTDCTDEQGRKRLANSLYRMRQEHPEIANYILGDATTLCLKPIWTDAQEFKQLMGSPEPQDWFKALELYQGDLIEGEDLPWLDNWRSELHQAMLSGLRQALQHCLATDSSRAIQLAQRLILLEPWNEEAHTHLIRLYATEKRLPEAISTFEKLETILSQEFSSQAKPETQVFIKDLKRQLEQQNNQAQQVMVGRNREWQSLTNALNAVRVGQGNIILLEGEPGLGKTRLLLELKSLAQWHQIPVLYGAAANSTPAYAPLEQAIQNVAVLLEQATALIQKNLEPLVRNSSDSESQANPQVVTAALERWLRHLEQPTIWLLDDLHWAGDLFWTVLKMLARITKQRPVLLVLSARSQELKDNQKATETITEIRQNQQILHFALDGLSLEECTQLARGQGKKIGVKELEQMHRISAGNPLVFQELVLGNKADKHLEDAFQSRFNKLDSKAQDALEAASVLGKHLDLETWEAMLGVQPPIAQLLETRFLHSEPALGFQHDLTRVFVYEQMKLEIRQKWHGVAFEVLKIQKAQAAVLAHHAEEAGLLAQSVPFYRMAAEEAFSLSSFQETHSYINQARTNNQIPLPNQLEMTYLNLLELQLAQTESPGNQTIEEIESLEIAAREQQDSKLIFRIMRLKVTILADKGEKQLTFAAAEALLSFTREIKDAAREIDALSSISAIIAKTFLESEMALHFAMSAYQLSQITAIPVQQKFRMFTALINSQIRNGKYDIAWQVLGEAETLLEIHPELAAQAFQLYNIKGALAHLNEHFELACKVFQKQLDVCYTLGIGKAIDATLSNISESLKMLGRFEEALVWAEELAERAPKAKDQLDESQIAYYFGDLAEVFLLLGRTQDAEYIVLPLIKWLQKMPNSYSTAKAKKVLVLAYHTQKRYSEALELLNFQGEKQNMRIIAELEFLAGNKEKAEKALTEVLAEQGLYEKNAGSMRVYYTTYLIYQKPMDLELARFALLRFATQIETLENRQVMLSNVYYAKAIETAWQQQNLETIIIELPALTGEGTIEVTWTLDSGASDKAHLEQNGKVALRNHRLKRLMLEAQAQGAKALQRQLATALGVTVRTIEMDMAQLRTDNQISTRASD